MTIQEKEYYSEYMVLVAPDAQFTPTSNTILLVILYLQSTIMDCLLVTVISIADQSITFTCTTMDSNKTEHALPDTDQYASGKSLPITAVTTIRLL